MAIEITGLDALNNLFSNLYSWTFRRSRDDIDLGAKDIAKGLREGLRAGLGADGSPLTPLKKSTLDGPVRRENDNRVRSGMGASPLHATGKTAASINSNKTDFNTWEIGSDTELGNAILVSNAKTTHDGLPFAGDVNKAVRDPIQVTDKQMDILEKNLLDGLERVLSG